MVLKEGGEGGLLGWEGRYQCQRWDFCHLIGGVSVIVNIMIVDLSMQNYR